MAWLRSAEPLAELEQGGDQSRSFSFMAFLLQISSLFYFIFFFFHNQSLESFFVPIQARDQTGQTSAVVFFLIIIMI